MAPQAPPATPKVAPTPATKVEERTQLAPRWKVILHNDDVTTFEFVTELLIGVFHKEEGEAMRLTDEIHRTGAALVAVANQERAELYVEQVRSLARPRGFPLVASMEPE